MSSADEAARNRNEPLDDRGRPAPLVRLRDLRRSTDAGEPSERREQRRALYRRLKTAVKEERSRWSLKRVFTIVLHTALFIGVGVLVAIFDLGFMTWLIGQFFTHGLLIFFWRSLDTNRLAPFLARTAISEGWCGSCGYSLEGLSGMEDGCIVCPECGAAWSAPRINRAHWDSPRLEFRQPNILSRFVFQTHRSDQNLAPDARGKLVRVLDSRFRSLPREVREAIARTMRRACTDRVRQIGLAARTLTAAVLILVPSPCIFSVLINHSPSARAMMISLTVMFLLCLVAAIATARSDSFIRPARAACAFIACGVCASCADLLANADHLPDGCMVCRRCGSVWKPPPDGESD